MGYRTWSWKLHNRTDRTLAQQINRLTKLLVRNCPDEYVIQKVVCTFADGAVQAYDVNRRLDHDRRKVMVRFLKKHQHGMSGIHLQFINYSRRDNILISLSGDAPFDELALNTENAPTWLRELINRKFNSEISWHHKLWSYVYNRRPFRHSLGQD